MNEVTHICLVMEDCQEIWFKKEEIVDFVIQPSTMSYQKINDKIVGMKSIIAMGMQLSANANHTYNCFGNPSEQTTFCRILDNPDIGAVILRFDDDSETTFYALEDTDYNVALDECGDLIVMMKSIPGVTIDGCCEDCCEECELEF